LPLVTAYIPLYKGKVVDNHDDTWTDGGIATFIRGCSLPFETLRAIQH